MFRYICPALKASPCLAKRKERKRKNKVIAKRKISRKLVLRLLMFVAVIGIATILDIYLKEGKVKITGFESSSHEDSKDQRTVQIISQSSDLGVKSFTQKNVVRKVNLKLHDKYLQKYYQLRKNQVLKAEVQIQTAPIINAYHYLAFKNFFFSVPDDIPLIS